MGNRKLQVIIADDHERLLELTRNLLEPEFEVVGSVRDGEELLSAVKTLNPDVVVTDLSMPRMDGLTAAGLILSDNPDARIILLTQHNDPEIARICLKAGLLGYVLKTDLDYELSQAIHAASRGDFFVCRRIK